MGLRGFVVIVGLVLSGCAGLPQKPLQTYRWANQQHLQQLQHWVLEGRLAIVTPKDSLSVSMLWQHAAAGDDIELSGPLAQGKIKLSLRPGHITIDDGEAVQVYQGDVDEVVSSQLGLTLPLGSLVYWVLGIADPRVAVAEIDGGFVQSGWSLRMMEMQTVAGEQLPRKLQAEKAGVRLKLIADKWSFS